jgi:ribosome biogenesis GTPase / thiamine phosphate phosphatase
LKYSVKRKPPQTSSIHESRITNHALSLKGQIVGSFGRRYLVELPDLSLLDCVTRGRRGALACGDRVVVARTAEGQGVIESLDPRASLFYRSDRIRQKLFAANVTQIVVVVAPQPPYSEDLVNRCLAAAEGAGVAALIALNKSELPQAGETSKALEIYRRLGYRVETLSAKRDVSPLLRHLRGRTSVLVGQSGMGKSTIINALVPNAAARVAELSRALRSGRHTTTHARLYHLDEGSNLVDSPGLQEFGLHHLDPDGLAHAFVEFRPWLGQCKFRDCRHVTEPGCAIAAACERGEISERRLASYRGLVRERGR